jgi:hypothetical protein
MASLEDMTTDQLLAHARRLEEQTQSFARIAQDPTAKEAMQAAAKKINPNLSIPEYDAKVAVNSAIEAEREERRKLEQRLMEREAKETIRERRESIRKKYSLKDADIEAIEQLILENKAEQWSHDTAAQMYLASKRSATPTPASYAPPTYSMPEKDVWGPGIGNKSMLDKIAINQAFEAFNEIKSGRVAQ